MNWGKGRETPCDTCIPALSGNNVQVVEMYHLLQGQVITGPSGAIDVNLGTVLDVLERHGINSKKTFDRVVLAIRHKLRKGKDGA